MERYRPFGLAICDRAPCLRYGEMGGGFCRDEGHTITVEYVPAEQLPEAVEALELLLSPIIGSAEFVESERARRLQLAMTTLHSLRGGQ